MYSKTTIIPPRQTLFQFLKTYNKGNSIILSKMLLIPITNYSIFAEKKKQATITFSLSALIDYVMNKPYTEPSIAPLLSQFLDKMLLGSTVLSLSMKKRIPTRIASNIFSRDILLSFGSLLHRFFVFPHPIEWKNFFDTQKFASFEISPTFFSRINTSMTTLLTLLVLINWSWKPPLVRGLISFLPKCMDICSIFSFIEYFLPPRVVKQRNVGVFSSLFI